jgi:hypothetical protein
MTTALPKIRAILFRDGEWYSAQCLEYDIAAQAKTLEDLRYELQRVIITHIAVSIELGSKPFENLDAAPQKFWDMYANAKTEINPVDTEDSFFRMPDPYMINPMPSYRLFEKTS